MTMVERIAPIHLVRWYELEEDGPQVINDTEVVQYKDHRPFVEALEGHMPVRVFQHNIWEPTDYYTSTSSFFFMDRNRGIHLYPKTFVGRPDYQHSVEPVEQKVASLHVRKVEGMIRVDPFRGDVYQIYEADYAPYRDIQAKTAQQPLNWLEGVTEVVTADPSQVFIQYLPLRGDWTVVDATAGRNHVVTVMDKGVDEAVAQLRDRFPGIHLRDNSEVARWEAFLVGNR